MSVTRVAIHRKLDEQLSQMGYKETVEIEDGAILISVQIKNGRIVQTTKEREFIAEAHR